MENNDLSGSVIFPKGMKVEGPMATVFIGSAWVEILVTNKVFNCPIYNVTFEPRARNHWHSHPGGQILLVTGGKGYYQEEGKPARPLKTGDAVEILPNVKHWHGAAADSWFVHLGVSTNPQAGDAEWFGPVTEEQYTEVLKETL